MHHVFSFECVRLLRILRLIHSHFFTVISTFFDIKRITKYLLSFCWLSSKIQCFFMPLDPLAVADIVTFLGVRKLYESKGTGSTTNKFVLSFEV